MHLSQMTLIYFEIGSRTIFAYCSKQIESNFTVNVDFSERIDLYKHYRKYRQQYFYLIFYVTFMRMFVAKHFTKFSLKKQQNDHFV